MMSMIKVMRQQLLRPAEPERRLISEPVNPDQQRPLPVGHSVWRAALLGWLLPLLGLPNSSPAAAQTVGGIPAEATAHATINFSQLAQREVAANLTAFRTNRVVRQFMAPPGHPSNQAGPSAPAPMSASASAASAGAPIYSPQPASSFLALNDNGTFIPPDTQGAVGPNHLLVALNSEIRIQNRTGGTISTMSTFGFWQILLPGLQDVSDPHVVYDPFNDRWIFSMIADPLLPSSAVLMAVSQTSDPTGTWFAYRVDADSSNLFWADYPTLGFNKDWIVVTVNMFANFGSGYGGANIYVFNKTNLYANGAGAFTFFQDNITPGFTMAPAVTYDNSLSTLYMVEVDQMAFASSGNRLRISAITGSVGSELLTLGAAFASAPSDWAFYEPTFGGSAPQLGSPKKIEANDSRIMNAVYRNGSLWCSHPVFLPTANPTHSAAQWWQIAPDGTVQQFGRVEDPAGVIWYAFPSIAVNKNSDVMLGYASFSSLQYASANYSFRSAGDPPDTMQADAVLKAGLAPYFKDFGGGQNRWGDYSATVVDPVNDVDMWTIQEYAAAPAGGEDRWGTWWGQLDVVNLAGSRFEFSASSYTVAENTPGFATITVNNVGGFPGTVDYAATNGTALAGTDYLPANGTLTFAAGQLATNFPIVIGDNGVPNSNKTVQISLFNPTGGAVLGNPTEAVLTIIDDETQAIISTAGEFNFSSSIYFVTEDETFPAPTPREPAFVLLPDHTAYGALITVVRTNGATGRVLVDYATVPGGTALPFLDYLPVSGTMVFDDFQMSTNFVVEVGSDFRRDGDKFVNLELSNPRPDPLEDPFSIRPTLGLGNASVIDIIEINEGLIDSTGKTNNFFNVERAFYRVDEYNAPLTSGGTREIWVDVVLMPGGGPGVVEAFLWPPGGGQGGEYGYFQAAGSDYADVLTTPGPLPIITDPALTYAAYPDYIPYTTNLTFGQGERRKRFVITVTNDPMVEFNEDFLVHLRSVPNQPGLGPNPFANVTILFNDQPAGALDREWNPDSTFATTPPTNAVPGANNTVQALVVQPDGKAVLGGDFTAYNAVPRPHVARINPDGSIDFSFDPGLGVGPNDAFVSSVALYSASAGTDSGKILIGGGFTSVNGLQRNGIARLLTNGSLDATFTPGNGADGPIRSLALQPDGKILVAGDFTQFNDVQRSGFARLNPDGSVDLNFDTGAGADGMVRTIAFDNAGRVLVGGDFLSINNVFSGRIARLNLNGSLDTTFNPGGADDGVYSIAVQTDGSILIGGAFSRIGVYFRSGIARLNPDGSLDFSYDPGAGADAAITAVVLQPDNKALIGGYFTHYDNTRRIGLARLKPNGTLDTSFMDTAYNQFAGLINTFSFEPPNFLNAIALQPDGNVMIGGSFHQIGGNPSYTVPWRNYWTVYTRADKRPRYNIARVLGGVTPGPGNAEFDASEYFVDENGGNASIRLHRLDGRLGGLQAIDVSSNRTAVAGVDFDGTVQTNIWPEFAYVAPIGVGFVGFIYNTVPIINNSLQDGNRVLDLTLARAEGGMTLGGEFIPLGGALGKHSAPVTIVDDDFSKGVFTFSSIAYATNENAGSAIITVLRTNGSVGSVSVDYFTRNSPLPPVAAAGVDYTPARGKLTFLSGQTTRTFTVPILDNTVVEFDKNVELVLTNATGGAKLPGGTPTSIATATLTILDNDFPPGRINFSASTYDTSSESDGFANITVTRTGGNVGLVSVQFQTLDGTAISPRDYLAANVVLSWNDGESAPRIFPVPLFQNGLATGPATVNLRLSDPRIGGTPNTTLLGLRTNATLIIQDSDAAGTVAFSQPFYQADENGGLVTIPVTRTAGVAGFGSVNFAASPNTAAAGIDYVPTNGVLTFLPGQISQTFQVAVIDNSAQDGNRALSLTLSNPVNVRLGALSSVTLTIVDDESFNEPPGSADVSFRDPLVDGPIYSIALQKTNGVSDGRLMIAGDFTSVNHAVRNRLARLLINGVLDATFDAGSGANGSIRVTAIQSDGKILLGGSFTQVSGTNRSYLARVTVDGALDAFFNPGSGADNPVFALVLQPDDKVLAGGAFSKFNSVTRPGIVRLSTNGAVDLSFNAGSGPNDTVYGVALQADGKVVIGGEFTEVNGIPFNHLARLNPNGSLDPTFSNLGAGMNAAVKAILVQSDGKLVVGGSFTSVNGVVRNFLARLNADGSLDTQFMDGLAGADNTVYAIASQVDGKLVVAGDFLSFNGVTRSRLTRLLADGANDETINFGSGADGFINAVVIQPDRKIVLAGGFTIYDEQPHNYIMRIHGGAVAGPGRLTFSRGEFQVSERGTNAVITVKRVGGTTGLVGVNFSTSDGTALSGRDYLARNGSLVFPGGETVQQFMVPIIDNTVTNEDRFLNLALSGYSGGAISGPQPLATLLIQNDESAIGFTSDTFSVSENTISGTATITFRRTYATNNTVSALFSTIDGGTAPPSVKYLPTNSVVTFLPGEILKSATVRIINETNFEGNQTVFLVLSNSLSNPSSPTFVDIPAATLTIVDDDFGHGVISFSAPAYTVAENGTNAVITLFRTGGSLGLVSVHYATAGGSATAGLDYVPQNGTLTFGQGQISKTILIPIIDDTLVEGDENFTLTISNPLGGATIGGPTSVSVVIEDNEIGAGSLDSTFNPGTGTDHLVRSVAAQPDGKVLIAGAFTNVNGTPRNFAARLKTNGTLDLNFNAGSGPNGFVSSIGVNEAGKVFIGGVFSLVNGIAHNRVAQFLANGGLDPSFAQSNGLNSAVFSLLPRPNGKVIVGGGFTLPIAGVARLRPDGSGDVTFFVGSGLNGALQSVVAHANGQVIVGGEFTTVDDVDRSHVARLQGDGTLDDSFTPPDIAGSILAVEVQPDGKVILGGDFTALGGLRRYRIARLNADGSLDTNFAANLGADASVYGLALQTDGKVLLGGDFTSLNGTNRNHIGRLNADGSLDLSFDPGTGANGTVYSVALAWDGKVLLGGAFTTVSGAPRPGIARLNGNQPSVRSQPLPGYAGGPFSLVCSSQAGSLYALEAAANLSGWTALSTNMALGTSLIFTDSNAIRFGQRFYRVRQVIP